MKFMDSVVVQPNSLEFLGNNKMALWFVNACFLNHIAVIGSEIMFNSRNPICWFRDNPIPTIILQIMKNTLLTIPCICVLSDDLIVVLIPSLYLVIIHFMHNIFLPLRGCPDLCLKRQVFSREPRACFIYTLALQRHPHHRVVI